jgi:pimeloyl-ACP methyl ester carboxylesterase
MSPASEPEARAGFPLFRTTDRSDDPPVVTSTARSRGFDIRYEDRGSGGAIVLIPGHAASAADWRNAGYVAELAMSHRVLNVDPLGNGLSDKPHEPRAYLWQGVVADIVACMDNADVDRAVIWGYSRGAEMAAGIAATIPDRVTGLILGGADDLVAGLPAGTPLSPEMEALWQGTFERLGAPFTAADQAYYEAFNDPVAIGARGIGSRLSGIVIDFAHIRAPTLLYVGGADLPEAQAGNAAALGVEVTVIPALDHVEGFGRSDLVMPLVFGFLEPRGL